MNLELKYLSAYLPYKVKVSSLHTLNVRNGIGGIEHLLTTKNKVFKLHLRPLSSLTEEIDINGERFIPANWFGKGNFNVESVLDNKFTIVQKLLEWHFDIYNLIEKGLAISIHDVE
jgi:hypothetical protein